MDYPQGPPRLILMDWTVLEEGAYLFFLAARLAYTCNNNTETVLIKSLLGPLALASHWRTLTY